MTGVEAPRGIRLERSMVGEPLAEELFSFTMVLFSFTMLRQETSFNSKAPTWSERKKDMTIVH